MEEIKKITGKITGIHIEDIDLKKPFINFAARFAKMSGTVVLMSGQDLDCARYHILAAKPWFVFSGYKKNMTITVEKDRKFEFKADPFDTLQKIINEFRLDGFDPDKIDLPGPIVAGLFGYLSYDLKDTLETLPRTSIDDLLLPHIYFVAPSIIVVHDKLSETTRLFIPERCSSGKSSPDDDLDYFKRITSGSSPEKKSFGGDREGFKSNFKKDRYIAAIEKIKEYISAGHVYQVNMSQRFEMDFNGAPFDLFSSLYKRNPAPFFAYINAENHYIVSTSPERFLLQTGHTVETRPIKGTRPRGETEVEDKKLGQELKESRKDDAELSMIVDLMRNDIGKVCRAKTVKVKEHKRLEAYQNVYHLISIITGRLDDHCDSVDLLRATFPGGSITGCPKIRTMEIIDELEPCRRHIYTGSIGYISFHNTMDLSIVIRTATIYNGKILFSVGGGIVFDSDPQDEYDETLHKGMTLMNVFTGKEKKDSKTDHVWFNGVIEPVDQVSIPITDPGFFYGHGFFETIRVDKGKTVYLPEHIQRFYRAWKDLFGENPPDLTWNEVINQVINENSLKDKTAAVKLIATRGDREKPPLNHNLVVTARPYVHRLADKQEKGLHLTVYPHPRQTPLADHKTLNYLYYFLAGKWAKDKNTDEAVILNPDQTVSETNTANMLLIKDKTVILPISPHVLPGIMEKAVLCLLKDWEFKVKKQKVFKKEIFSFDEIILTNSLMGAAPALSVDGKDLPLPSDLYRKINKEVF